MRKNATKDEEKRQESKRNRRFGLFGLVGVAAGFGSWGYFVLAPDPSFYLGLVILLCCPLFLWIAVMDWVRSKLVKTVSFIVLVVACVYLSRWAERAWETRIKNDVLAKVSMTISLPHSENAWESVISIKNDSAATLTQYKVSCEVAGIRTQNDDWIHNVGMTVVLSGETLRRYGDAVSVPCISEKAFVRTRSPIACADLVVIMSYEIEESPALHGSKSVRFSTITDHGKLDWHQQPVERTISVCQP
jgi:hypothetical protein